ncbi:MAG: type II and III secretion system protein family protein [Bacteroidota bacterium]
MTIIRTTKCRARQAANALGRLAAATALASGLLLGTDALLATEESPVITVPSGGQHLMKLPKPVHRVAVGNGEVAEAKVLNSRELLLQGNRPGETSLLVWLKGGAAATSYRLQVNKAAGVPAGAGASDINLRASGDLTILGGTPQDMAQHDAARQVAQHAGGDGKGAVLDTTALPYGGEVQIDVRVVEFSRKILKKAGLSLLSNKSGFTFGTFGPGELTKVQINSSGISTEATLPISQALNLVIGSASKNIVGILSVLEGNGFARTLAQPTLVAQSGRTANFLAGGEFPVPVPQALGQTTIQYKPFGIRLEVSPTVLAANRIALTVEPEVSDLNFENAITINGVAVPSLTTRRAGTSIELGNGESFVIGGLVSQSVMKNINKIPGLGDIPVLGAFFKSVSLSREDKELLFIVTPRLVQPLAVGTDLGPLPGEDKANYSPSLWNTLLLSDDDENARYTGFSK